MGTLILLAVFGLIVGVIAKNKGRSFAPWFLYGALLFVVALVHILVVSDSKKTMKQCEACQSYIPLGATVCSFCRMKQKTEVASIIKERRTIEDKKHQHDTRNIVIAVVLFVIAAFLFHIGMVGHL